ncbi:MAG: lycopene cyclase family protein, partial [Proteobacteria bacterium]|nr:lycopene cyclase family protein [Pseudomonadota bacterium]
MTQHDIVLVGGGLQGCLCVLALAHERPSARVVLIEAGSALGGNHTWCFHAGDAAAGAHAWIDAAIAHRWDGYDVAFAEHERRLASPYAAISSESLDLAV